ncbi:HNH endonuclease [Mycobacteroides abscessus]|uniref:HNH endonuclease n=1 Tax=Mycobacteroides abscessus TaxID=36809 RepID=UPI000473748A|nr:HNH endonuclease [Mycobacteroides abscessus]
MPRAPKLCANASCIALVTPPLRYCPEHKTSGWARSPRTASADRTNTRAWKMQRVRCLQRDGHQCQIRGPRCTVTATQVDHITPVSQGGSDELSNLRAVCVSCHAVKTAREARDARL